MQRLGKNHGGYLGETIDIRAVLREVETVAHLHSWSSEIFHEQGELKLFAFRRTPTSSSRSATQRHPRLYISAGIHGDEPAGPLAAMKLLQENCWPDNVEIILLPCLNPVGFVLNRRENGEGIDLNRDYRNSKSAETRAHFAWLERQPKFDIYLCLHEDWESHGFYLYEQNPDHQPSVADKIIAVVRNVCPVDRSELIEGRPAKDGVIRPNIQPDERPDWPEAFYLITSKSRLGYTLEAPSDFPLITRINALVIAVQTAARFLSATRMEML